MLEWKMYFQSPEMCDDQGLYLKAPGEPPPWQTETDCEEFDHILRAEEMEESGYVRDLESANAVLAWLGVSGTVTEIEIW